MFVIFGFFCVVFLAGSVVLVRFSDRNMFFLHGLGSIEHTTVCGFDLAKNNMFVENCVNMMFAIIVVVGLCHDVFSP